MEFVLDILTDAIGDTLRLLPFLFLTYLAMEALEHKAGERAENAIRKAGSAGPALGALLGLFPQCGFSAAAATFYAGRVVTLGTLFAVFLATSDEMLPIFIAEQVDLFVLLKVLGVKLIVGMAMGFSVDAALRLGFGREAKGGVSKGGKPGGRAPGGRAPHSIHDLCEQEGCDCHDGILKSSLKHTLQVTLFIFLVTVVLNAAIEGLGEDVLAGFLSTNEVFSVFATSLVGLIPNCAASVVITELYLEGALGAGAMIAGLLVSAGLGLLVLFRTNRPFRQNLAILGILYVMGVLVGLAITATGMSF